MSWKRAFWGAPQFSGGADGVLFLNLCTGYMGVFKNSLNYMCWVYSRISFSNSENEPNFNNKGLVK